MVQNLENTGVNSVGDTIQHRDNRFLLHHVSDNVALDSIGFLNRRRNMLEGPVIYFHKLKYDTSINFYCKCIQEKLTRECGVTSD